ncbi:metal-sensing transcriptional repressor [Patescibacteria group bacterium]|nr:metal-sensing transcriptional repressor [Patescibacteria group bacterium]
MQDPVISRLHRIKGQIEAVERMYKARKACIEVVRQVQAARAALGRLAGILLTDEAKRCVDAGDLKELEKIVNKTFKIV